MPYFDLRIAKPAISFGCANCAEVLGFLCRVQGIVLIGVPTLPLDIMAATSDVRWSSFTVVRDPKSGDMREVFKIARIPVS